MNYITLAIIAAVIFGIAEIIKKQTLKREATYEYLVLLYIFSFLIILPFCYRNLSLNLSSLTLLLIFARSLLSIVALFFITIALKHLPISTVSPLSSMEPIYTLLFGFFLLNERIGVANITGIAVILIGSYILKTEGYLTNYHKTIRDLIGSKYLHFILLASLFGSLTSVFSKIILKDISSYNLLFYHYIFCVTILLSIGILTRNEIRKIKIGWKLGGFKILIISVMGTIASYLSFLSFASIDSKVMIIVPIMQISILIEVIAGGKLFHEHHLVAKVLGSVIIIGGVLLCSIF